ncbi:N-lysine methyltransferase SETD8-A [Babesia sp. Xinjiang]|uniref:N-lysine methyltransferase SETD8-A n=1 Tax=Babesia sp. Xinjiang TaxID=462227 RepID=UPI000A259F3C|nr:N-lysine methyltransferase SETD8-A [Babesia sp. Xinjiang]ORM39724.1 N-lysine methyltransferase SETD8-A [Babesia sp. Xinjiang]
MVQPLFFAGQRCSVISSILSDSKESINDDYDIMSATTSPLRSQSSINCTPYIRQLPPAAVDCLNTLYRNNGEGTDSLKSVKGANEHSMARGQAVMNDGGGNSNVTVDHRKPSDMATPITTCKMTSLNINRRCYPQEQLEPGINLDYTNDDQVPTRTPTLTRQTTDKQSSSTGSWNSEADPALDISPFVKSSRYGQHDQKFKLVWLPNTEVSSLMRVPSIAQLSKKLSKNAELLYLVYTPGGMDIIQDASAIVDLEKRQNHTPFVILYSYSFKSMYFKVVGRELDASSTITFGEDGEPTSITNEDELGTGTSSRRRARAYNSDSNYVFYRSYLYGRDDDQQALQIKMSVRSLKEAGLDMRETPIQAMENGRTRSTPTNRTPKNRIFRNSSVDSEQLNSFTECIARSQSELSSMRSLESLQFDGGVPPEGSATQETVQRSARHGNWVYATVDDHNSDDEIICGLPSVLWTELRRLLGTDGNITLPQCNVSMANHRMEAMIKRNFELYDQNYEQISTDVIHDLQPASCEEQNHGTMYQIDDFTVRVGDVLVVKFPTTYRVWHMEEDVVKIYDNDTLKRCFDTLATLGDEKPTDITVELAQYCPNIFWNLVFGGDLDDMLRKMAPNVYGTARKRRRAAVKNDATSLSTRRGLTTRRFSDTPVFDNNFVIMQNMFEQDAQVKIQRLEKIRDQQRDSNGKLARSILSKYLDDDELIAAVMDPDGFLIKSMQILTPAQKTVVYSTCLRRGLYAPVRLDYLPKKGRAVFAAYDIGKDEFVVEYKGHIITEKMAKFRDQKYDKSKSYKGSYVFYFKVHTKRYGIDATEEDIKFGPARLINHSRKNPNVVPKALEIDGCPRLFFVAKRDIKSGEELLIDYGERDPYVIKGNPWLLD